MQLTFAMLKYVEPMYTYILCNDSICFKSVSTMGT